MNNYDLLLKGVRSIVNKHDPIGLISGGAPEDEYDGEIIKITKLFLTEQTNLAKGISQIFADSFGEEISQSESKYDLIAKEISDKYSSFFKLPEDK